MIEVGLSDLGRRGILAGFFFANGAIFFYCSRGPTPARSRSAARRLARAAGAPFKLFLRVRAFVSESGTEWPERIP